MLIAENFNAEELINQMNGDNNSHEDYLTALENLCVGKAEPARTNFYSAIQERNESIQLFASKLNSLKSLSPLGLHLDLIGGVSQVSM